MKHQIEAKNVTLEQEHDARNCVQRKIPFVGRLKSVIVAALLATLMVSFLPAAGNIGIGTQEVQAATWSPFLDFNQTQPVRRPRVTGWVNPNARVYLHVRNVTTGNRLDIGAGTCGRGRNVSHRNGRVDFHIPRTLIHGHWYRVAIETRHSCGTVQWYTRYFTARR